MFLAVGANYLIYQNMNANNSYASLGCLIAASLILGWWPKSFFMRFVNLSGLIFFTWIVTIAQPNGQNVGFVASLCFVLPAILSMGVRIAIQRLSQPSQADVELLATKQPIELVQMIDNSLNCLIGVNNVWIQNNWSKLDDEEKIVFITKHRESINSKLPYTRNTIDVIQLLQNISRGL